MRIEQMIMEIPFCNDTHLELIAMCLVDIPSSSAARHLVAAQMQTRNLSILQTAETPKSKLLLMNMGLGSW